MIWLQNNNLQDLGDLKVDRTFVLGDLMYVMQDHSSHPFFMFSIDLISHAIKKDFTLDRADFGDHVFVYNGVAYTYLGHQKEMVSGTLESVVLHWRIVNTTGQKPLDSFSISTGTITNGTGKYIMHVADQFDLEPEGCFDDTSFNCELDLDTMAWTRVKADFIYQLEWKSTIAATPKKLHVFLTEVIAGRHLIFDRATGKCVYKDDKLIDPEIGTAFVALDKLYFLARANAEDEMCVLNLYEFNESRKRWTKVWESPMNLEYLMVFDLNVPSLFDLALSNIMWHDEVFGDEIEQTISSELFERFIVRDDSEDHLIPQEFCPSPPPYNEDVEFAIREAYQAQLDFWSD